MTAIADSRPQRVPALPRLDNRMARIILITGLLVAWEALCRTGVLPATGFAALTDIVPAFADQVRTLEFWTSLGDSLTSWVLGLLICVAIAVPLGTLLGWSENAYRTSRVLIEFLRSTPPVVLIPFVLLFFGPSQEMKTVLIVLGAVWPLLIQTMYGVHDLDGVAVSTARAYHIKGVHFFTRIVLPSVAPYLITGARVAGVLALLLTIGSEMVTSAPGLGREIFHAQTNNDLAGMYALIVVAGVLGLALNGGFAVLERRLLKWHPSQRSRV